MCAACFLVSALLLAGQLLRRRFSVFDRIYVPASVIAGTLGLVVVQLASRHWLPGPIEAFVAQAAGSLRNWPATMIAIVFAAMLLQRSTRALRLGLRPTLCEGVMVWIIAVGQTAIGLTLTWLVIQPFYDVPNAFGMLVETGMAGGHGTAAAMGQVFMTPEIAFPVGLDLGLLMATAGLVYGTISGIVWINVAVRAGLATPRGEREADGIAVAASSRAQRLKPEGEYEYEGEPEHEHEQEGVETRELGHNRLVLGRLVRQFVWILAAYLVGLGLQAGVGGVAARLDAGGAKPQTVTIDDHAEQAAPVLEKLRWVSLVGSFPLFIYTLFGGLLIGQALVFAGRGQWLDGQASGRISGVAMDLLVVAAISTLNLDAVVAYLWPIVILFTGGAIWSAVCLFVFSPRLLPRSHWFELGLINYGMSTGTTATGFVLLRLVDPQLQTDAAKHYALAAPLSAPFVGGGVITIGLPLLVLERVPIGLSAIVLSVAVVLLILLGLRLAAPAGDRLPENFAR